MNLQKLNETNKNGSAFLFDDRKTRNLLFKSTVRKKLEDELANSNSNPAEDRVNFNEKIKRMTSINGSSPKNQTTKKKNDDNLHKIYQISKFRPTIDTSIPLLEKVKQMNESVNRSSIEKQSLTEKSLTKNLHLLTDTAYAVSPREEYTDRTMIFERKKKSKQKEIQKEIIRNETPAPLLTHSKAVDVNKSESKKKSLPFLKKSYVPDYFSSSIVSKSSNRLVSFEDSSSNKNQEKKLKNLVNGLGSTSGRSVRSKWLPENTKGYFNLSSNREDSSSRLISHLTCDDILSDVRALKEKFKKDLTEEK